MKTTNGSKSKIPVICVDPSGWEGANIFNPNIWSGGSKGVVQSCWSEYSVLCFCAEQISSMCNDAELLCETHIATLQEQWRIKKIDLGKVVILGEQPDLHIRIEAFFSGVKTLLDLLMQLLSTEKVVSADIDGFHRVKDNYGGRVLNVLRCNAVKERKDVAAKFDALILEHKKLWIDEVIRARDQLVHPEKGMHQLMFNLEFSEKDGTLFCDKVHPPVINSKPIHVYAQGTLKQITEFSSHFLALLSGLFHKLCYVFA
ncbi:hypothetical protein ACFL60_05850 [Candidatus Omnitrophota bacterium]